ncbi:MAG: SPOR domain-containing protein [Bacteroidales bacterium]|nr:SPOR domain-containing protein [Bacteroidales bacterium]
MKISKYIGDLLFQYECVVIPDFGGFITNEIPATINPVQHNFSPPSKEIVFNIHLKTNDGLLVNHVAHSEKISYKESKTRIEKFAGKCLLELKNGKRINFHNVGFLFLDDNENVIFKQDIKNNYNSDSFGLTSFISPPIKRISQPEKIGKSFINRKNFAAKINFRKTAKWGSIAITLLAILIWSFFNVNSVKNLYENYAHFFPFLYSSPSDYLVKNINKFPIKNISDNDSEKKIDEKIIDTPIVVEEILSTSNQDEEKERQLDKEQVEIDNSKSVEVYETSEKPIEKPIEKEKFQKDQSDLVQPDQLPEAVKNEESIPEYFIIGGAFESLSNAEKLVENLKNQGFDSEIVGLNKYGLYRVSYSKFSDRAEASKQLKIIKKDKNPSAWIFAK